MNEIDRIRALAKVLHKGQKYGEGDYFTNHVQAVVDEVRATKGVYYFHIAVAYLHDVLEDTQVTAQDLLDLGVDEMVVEVVEALTRNPDETYAEYIERVGQHPEARVVKVADLNVNLSNAPSASLAKRYEKALSKLNEMN